MKSLTPTIKLKKSHITIIFSMLIPLALAMISLIFISSYNYVQRKEQAQESSLSSMQLFSQRCENEILNIVYSSALLSENTNFKGALDNQAALNDHEVLFSIQDTMKDFCIANPLIYNILIINQHDEYVISETGSFSFNKYFSQFFSYENYPQDYWKNYRYYTYFKHRILPPSLVNSSEQTDAVLPLIIFSNKVAYFDNLLVLNISIEELLSLQNDYLKEDDTTIYLMNNKKGDVFYYSGKELCTENVYGTELYSNLLTLDSFQYTLSDNERYFIIPFNPSGNLSGYTYYATIPYKNIERIEFSEILFSMMIFLFFSMISIVISVKNTNKIITPIEQAITTINPQHNVTGDIFESLTTAVHSMQNVNSNLTSILPFAQEKYLINFLNSAESKLTNETQEIIRNTLSFKHPYFASVVLQTYPTKLFFETYSQEEYSEIQAEINRLARQLFCEKYSAFFLNSDKDILYIILNTPNESAMDDICTTVSSINGLLTQYNDYLYIYAGLGGIYKDWKGLKLAHTEAISNLKNMNPPMPKIIIHQNELLNDAKLSTLYNALITFNTVYARKLIDEYTSNAGQDPYWLKQLYTQILASIFKAMHTRNVSYTEEFSEFEMYSNILTKSCPEIYVEILSLLDTIQIAKENANPEALAVEIIEYINQNYACADLSLASLAEQFQVQPTYVSTLVKNTLGEGFHKHLSALRIARAKELLTHTNKDIQEIYEECGFYSKPTFFRVFKQSTGLTPSEYRKSQK